MAASARKPTSNIKRAMLFPLMYRLVCCYRGGRASRGGNDIEGEYSHVKYHEEASR